MIRGSRSAMVVAVLLSSFPFTVLAAPPLRVGVAVSGDSAGAARLQQLVERMSLPNAQMRTAVDLTDGTAQGLPAAPDEATKERVKLIFAAVERDFQDAKFDEAIAGLNRMPPSAGPDDIALEHLWRAAIELKRGNELAATAEAKSAFLNNAALEIPQASFPPSAITFFNTTKASMKQVPVQVDAWPATAKVVLDGRVLAGQSFVAYAGHHKLRVVAPGYAYADPALDIPETAAAPIVVPVVLPLQLKPAAEQTIANVLTSPQSSAADAKTLEGLAGNDTDAFVAVVVRPDATRAVVWVRNSGRAPAKKSFPGVPAVVDSTVAEWIATTLRDTPRTPVAVATPAATARPSATPRPPSNVRPAASSAALATWVDAGLGFSSRQRSLAGSGGWKTLSWGYAGVGPSVRAGVNFSGVVGEAGFTYATYALSSIKAPNPADTSKQVTVGGGSTALGRVAVGYDLALGEGERGHQAFVGAMIGADFELYTAEKLASSESSFPSHTRLSPQVWIRGGYPVGSGLISAGVTFEPGGSYAETPSNADGKFKAMSGAGGRIAANFPLGRGGWSAGGSLEIFARSTTFTGPAKPAYSPALTDAKVSDVQQLFVGTIERQF